jgi:biotin transport system substrate-specific component
MNDRLNATLASALWPSRAASRIARAAALAIGGTLVLAISAKVEIPFYPVPLTLQTLAVLMIGAAFGARLAAATLVLYLAEGLAGLPVFAGPAAGPLYMAGPTGGYLAGFVAAAALVGWLAERGWDRNWLRLAGLMAIGHVVIFAFGFAWLALLMGSEKAWALGVAPFYAATLLKTLLAAALVGAAWTGLSRPRGSDA